jgi:hypothetical protein
MCYTPEALTFLQDKYARMVEQEISEGVAFGVDVWLPAQTRWAEEGERLECPQSRLALCDCHCGACDCNREQARTSASVAVVGSIS